MSKKVKKLDADIVIAGGGPGGCEIAKHFARKGKRVILVEKRAYSKRFLGTPLGAFTRLDLGLRVGLPLQTTIEGDVLNNAGGVGGGTLVFNRSAFPPVISYWKKYGIEFSQDILDEADKDTWVSEVPDEFIGQGTRRIWEAANDLGFPWHKQLRHVDFDKCKVGCEKCNFGCGRNASWTGMVFADEALRHGATILDHAKVREITHEGGVTGGVIAIGRGGQEYEIRAKIVVCSAGGMGTPPILKASGLWEAGSWFAGDPAFFTFGFVKHGKGNGYEHAMTIGWHDHEHEICFMAMQSPFLAWHFQLLGDQKFRAFRNLHRFKKVLSCFAKISDDDVGKVFLDGKLSKTLTEKDILKEEYARVTLQRILIKAGCDPNHICHTSTVMGHPSQTVRVGKMLDTNLETRIKNLYCCDTSVFPEAPGQPPALTVVCLAKRLARHLDTIV